jgi:hypothetical protein
MDYVDIILGYSWMDSVSTININVQKKFMKFWFKKKKITLQDIFLTKQEGPHQVAHEVVISEKLITIPIDTLYEQFEVEYEEESTKSYASRNHRLKSQKKNQ